MQNSETWPTTLLFYSPPYKGSDFFWHLVEHCVNQKKDHNYSHYFAFHQPLEIVYSHNFFSKTTIPCYIKPQEVIKHFQKPLLNKVISREIVVLRNELSSTRDQEELLADQVSTFLWYLMKSKTVTRVNYEKLREYHEQWYINWYWSVIHNNNTIIDTNITRWYDWPIQYSISNFIYREFRPKGYKYLVLIASTKNPYDAMFVEFLNILIDYREVYSLRYQKWQYYRRNYDSSYASGHIYIGISHLNTYSFDKDFFESAKRYFLDKERLINGKYMVRIWEILNHKRLDDQTIWKFISTINYDDVTAVIQKLQAV
jgi:hypothetical protein